MKAITDFDKYLYNLRKNSFYAKTKEDIRKRSNLDRQIEYP